MVDRARRESNCARKTIRIQYAGSRYLPWHDVVAAVGTAIGSRDISGLLRLDVVSWHRVKATVGKNGFVSSGLPLVIGCTRKK